MKALFVAVLLASARACGGSDSTPTPELHGIDWKHYPDGGRMFPDAGADAGAPTAPTGLCTCDPIAVTP